MAAGSLAVAGGGLHVVPESRWGRGAGRRARVSDPLAPGRDGDGGLAAGGEVRGRRGPRGGRRSRGPPGPVRSEQERGLGALVEQPVSWDLKDF